MTGPHGQMPDQPPEQPSADQPPSDHPALPYGAAPERTALAWQRTGLGLVIGCFLVFVTAVRLGIVPMAVVAGCLVVHAGEIR